jgi:vanillate monooxygenase ferredoxin subunit
MSLSLALTVRIATLRREAADIISLDLLDRDGRELPSFTAGSHIDVEILPDIVRQYSLMNDPAETARYSIAVLREPKSRGGSVAVHQNLKVGDALRISEPRNHFGLAAGARRSLLLAGGIGITPLYSMAHELSRKSGEFELHYCARSPGRAAFVGSMRKEAWGDHVHWHFDDGPASQKLDLDLLSGPKADDHLYVCGPPGFIEYILGAARERDWRPEHVHREYFAAAPVTAVPTESFSVQVASTGAVFEVPPGRTIVDVLAEGGVEIPTSCAEGVCGACVTKVLSGIPLHRDMVLSDDERANRLTPCCSRSRTPLLVLDL